MPSGRFYYPECHYCAYSKQDAQYQHYCLLHRKKLPFEPFIICREYVFRDGKENELSAGVLAANMQQIKFWGILYQGDAWNPGDISVMRQVVLVADLEDWDGTLPQG